MERMEVAKSIKGCGFCGEHFMLCQCEGLGQGNMILHPVHLPEPPAEMSPADHLYRWHVLYQATGIMNCDAHPTEQFLTEYTGAVVHFAAKNKQLLVSAAKEYVASWKQPFSWDHISADLTVGGP